MYQLQITMVRPNTTVKFFNRGNIEVVNYLEAINGVIHTVSKTKSPDSLTLSITIELTDDVGLDECNTVLDQFASVRAAEIQRRLDDGITTELTVHPLIRY